jgi:hypothetical protein
MGRKIRKPSPFQSKRIWAHALDAFGPSEKRRIEFGNLEDVYSIGTSVPSLDELNKFMAWLKKARAWARQRNLA